MTMAPEKVEEELDAHQATVEAPVVVGAVTGPWQLMDTAPRDGTEFVALSQSGARRTLKFKNGEWHYTTDIHCSMAHSRFTHWMPFPEPPESSLTAGPVPGTAGGQLDEDLLLERNRLREALEEIRDLEIEDVEPTSDSFNNWCCALLSAAMKMQAIAREALGAKQP